MWFTFSFVSSRTPGKEMIVWNQWISDNLWLFCFLVSTQSEGRRDTVMRDEIQIKQLYANFSSSIFGKYQRLREAWEITEPWGSSSVFPRELARSHRKMSWIEAGGFILWILHPVVWRPEDDVRVHTAEKIPIHDRVLLTGRKFCAICNWGPNRVMDLPEHLLRAMS